jgi:hypothetical protein
MATRTRVLGLAALMITMALAPGLARAGGWTVVVLDQTPEGVRAGQEFQVGFTVLQHGEKPIGGLAPRIDLSEATSGQRISATAKPQGDIGHYVANLTLPTEGTWTWTIETFGPLATLSPIVVAAAVPAAEPVAIASRIPIGMPLGLGALLITLALMGAAGMLIYRRRPTAAKAA